MWFQILFAIAAVSFACCLYGAVWRLYLSPLAPFPGPKVAALTMWYEIYHDVIKDGGGLYVWKIEELHKIYGLRYPSPPSGIDEHSVCGSVVVGHLLRHIYFLGPIVRINPFELHIADPDFYEQIYTGNASIRNKYGWHQRAAQAHGAIGHTVDHHLHRLRKDALSPFFSKKSVRCREDKIWAKVERLTQRIEGHIEAGEPLNLTTAYLATCMDIITEYAFGKGYGLLNERDYNAKWRDTIISIVKSVATITHFPWLPSLMRALPMSLTELLSPDVSQLLKYESRVQSQVNRILTYEDVKTEDSTSSQSCSIFEEIRDSGRLPPAEKLPRRLADEGNVLLIAASETPAKVLALISYHLIANPAMLRHVREELDGLQSSGPSSPRPTLAQLGALPYLKAVVKEGLRLHNGISARSQRIAPDEAIRYRQWEIPPGTPVSCMSVFMHFNETVFPEPRAFKPERWLEGQDVRRLDRCFVAFGKGTRSCLGYNLGMAELFVTLAAVVGGFEMRLFETAFEDVDMERDWFVPQPKKDTKGVRVVVERKRGQ